MNYLAHLFLAGTQPEMILGNFIADHVKGSNILKHSPITRKGISMHRAIDTYTDQHPVVRKSIARLRADFHKYAGVVVDMYYDHYLSANWDDYSNIDLQSFTKTRYAILNRFQHVLPLRSARLLFYMEKQNWLLSYGSLDGLQQALNGMSRRTTFVSNMENAIVNLEAGYAEFGNEFRQFFPDLQSFVKNNFDLANIDTELS